MERQIVLAAPQARTILDARRRGERTISVSLDLGLTTTKLVLTAEGMVLPDGEMLRFDALEEIAAAKPNAKVLPCYAIAGGEARPIRIFSEQTSRVYALALPAQAAAGDRAIAPTMLVSGIAMHRIAGTDPRRDTLAKVRAIAPILGEVLDTATGLGYTAIEAARTAAHVTTIELDPAVLEIARANPWSRALFEHPRITQLIGDSAELVEQLADESFDRIVHDPPVFSLGGQLYSEALYRHFYRVLRRGGRLFHYVGDPHSASGRGITRGVVRRLQAAGFSRVVARPEAFGVAAHKE